MRSFIKSHRKANSLEESPSSSLTSPGRHDNVASQGSIDEPLTFDPPTPPQLVQTSSGTKHSPGFESFHKLANKKMFSSKLFKKASSSNAIPQTTVPVTSHKEAASAPGTPQSRNSGSITDLSQFQESESKFPAIKGTITHNWGDQSRSHQPVIKLNCRSTLSNGSFQDLEPAVRIASLRRDSAISAFTCSSYENNMPSTASADENLSQRQELVRDRHIYNELSKVKSKNRQARIHSHDDMINFEKISTVSLELLASTVSPNVQLEEVERFAILEGNVQEETRMDRLNIVNESGKNNPATSKASTIDNKSSSGSPQETPTNSSRRHSEGDSEEDDVSFLLTPDFDDDEDDSSKFSFEIGGLNGRASSVKYYSKPEPTETVYIDDIYGEDNFDDEMNLYEDSLDDMEYPSGTFHVNDDNVASESGEMDTNGTTTTSQKAAKGLKNYNDLFDFSDEDEEEDSQFSETFTDTTQDDCKHDYLEEMQVDKNNGKGEVNSANDKKAPNLEAPSKGQLAAKPVKSFSDIFDLDDDDDDYADNSDGEYNNYGDDDNYGTDSDRNVSEEENSDIRVHSEKNSAAENVSDSTEPRRGDSVKDQVKNCASLSTPINPSQNSTAHSSAVHILVTSPTDTSSKPVTIEDPHLNSSGGTPLLPPPARSQALKIQDLYGSLDSEIPGTMSTLYFIDESEEDDYNERGNMPDEDCLDEINTVPEDYDFSDPEQELNIHKTPLRRSSKGSFRSTHSYSGQPTGTAKENTPSRNKLEIKNKMVTFFNNGWDLSPVDRSAQGSPQPFEVLKAIPGNASDDYLISVNSGEVYNPVTPTNSFSKPSPDYLNDVSLSPIQESTSSVDNSPRLPVG